MSILSSPTTQSLTSKNSICNQEQTSSCLWEVRAVLSPTGSLQLTLSIVVVLCTSCDLLRVWRSCPFLVALAQEDQYHVEPQH